MLSISPLDCARIAQDLQIRKVQVEAVVQLLEEGNTVPFMFRYRAELIGGLAEDMIRQVHKRVNAIRQLHDRKQTILKSIEHHGKLTDELRHAILSAETLRRLDDLYLPFKPKKRSAAAAARDRGLEPPALAIWHSDPAVGNLDELLPTLVNPDKELKTVEDVRTGIGQILAEWIAESADVRAPVRAALWEMGKIAAVKSEKVPEGQALEYKDFFQFSEAARQVPPHRVLVLNRGEKEGVLKLHLDFPRERIAEIALRALAELLQKKAGQMPALPLPAAPPAAVEAVTAAASEPAPPDAATGQPAAGEIVTPPAELASVPSDAAAGTDATADAAAAPAVAAPAAPLEAPAPLVASMEPKEPGSLTGEPLSPNCAFRSPHAAFLKSVLDDALTRLLLPNLEREIRRELTDEAEAHAVGLFARNLRSLLLQPPARGLRVLAIDPGIRSGCKVAVLDELGNLLDHLVIHPFVPARKPREKPAAAVSPKTETSTAPPTTEAPAPAPPQPEPAAPAATMAAATMANVATEVVAASQTVGSPAEAAPATPGVDASSPDTTNAAAVEAAPPTDAPASAAVEAASAPEPPPIDKRAESKAKLKDLIVKHNVQVVAVGNGSGCRETEELVSELIGTELPELSYTIVNEAGASSYAIGQVGREEFPMLDAAVRSAVSIGRRLQDPLSELVKVDSHGIGVGLHHHDSTRKDVREMIEAVVESTVNQVGADLNSVGVPLLRHISGLNQMVARELVEWRKVHGPFTSREQMLQLPGLGPQRWMQAVGFLRIPDAAHFLDRTWIHPESYGLAEKILAQVGCSSAALGDVGAHQEMCGKLAAQDIVSLANAVGAGVMTVNDLVYALLTPGYDPRSELPPPIFKKSMMRLEDLKPGMELKGTVLNVVDFGAFVDIGLKDSGLVHISQLANRYIKASHEVVAVNDVVRVWVLTVDMERRRVSLTMIPPGAERAAPPPRGRRAEDSRAEGGRAPRGRRSEGPSPAPTGTAAAPGQQRPRHEGPPREGFRPQRGRQYGRSHGRPPYQGAGAGSSSSQGAAEAAPPRKPRREPPKPKLTQAAIEGKVPLRTFSELSALFAVKKDKDAPPPPEEAAAAPSMPASPAEPTPAVAADRALSAADATPAAAPAAEAPPVGSPENG